MLPFGCPPRKLVPVLFCGCVFVSGAFCHSMLAPALISSPSAQAGRVEVNQSGKDAMLTEPAELQKRLRQAGLSILDTRSKGDYAQAHIPGAVWVNVKAWQQLGSKDGGFHDSKAWAEKVAQLGITKDTAVVVYGSSLPDAARIWWTLKYVGVSNVTLLDGGWELWTRENRPTDTKSPRIMAVKFEPNFQADRLEEIDSLKKSVQIGSVTVVDARSTKEYTGEEVRGNRGGHIVGAKHLEWKELLTAQGRFKPPHQLRELFRKRGIEPDQTAVTC
jgi:thiosulfate/3-mercaptopyruvate sulfurtransferase